jgi:hypothetical protein
MPKIFKKIKFEDRDSVNKAIPCITNGKMHRLAKLSAAFMARSCKSSRRWRRRGWRPEIGGNIFLILNMVKI